MTNAVEIRRSIPADGDRVVAIWCAAVDATHHFLDPADRLTIEQEVRTFLPDAPTWLALDRDAQPIGFMLLDGRRMEALFIDPDYRGRGIGRALVAHALALQQSITTDVNEQNDQAIGFYERLGFRRIGRSPMDGQGRPYPLIHLSSD